MDNKLKENKYSKIRIGLCWKGNPKFEHEQHRIFPHNLFFDSVKNIDAEFISLQKGKGEDEKPEWVEKVSLDTWEDTSKAIASCDLVITSCTSVAHLAGAMGIKTWIIIPILPYYLWALPGEKTSYYDSVTLFRQEKYGKWEEPFEKIKERLKKKFPEKLREKTTESSVYYPEVFSVQNIEQAKNIILIDENNENKWDIETKLSVEKLIKAFSITKDSKLLDYGCGIGRISKELIKQTNCTIIGVDSSSSMLKLSNDYVDSKNFKSYSIDDLKKLIDTGLKFDAAFSILVLQHSLNPQQDIDLIYSSLKNEGSFYLLNENKRFIPTKNPDSSFINWKDDGKNIIKLIEEKFTEIEDLSFNHLISKLYKKKNKESIIKKYLLEGNNLKQQGHDLQAADVFRKVIEIAPDYSEVYGLLGDSLISIGDYSEAEKVLLKAIELNPNYAIAMGNLGNSYVVRGLNAEAEKWYKKAVELMPENNNNHSNLMLCLNYGGHSKKEIYEEHLKWADMHTKHLEHEIKHENQSDPNKRLRIGYVSPDFRRHSVNYFFEPVLEAHDKNKIETFCYAEVDKPDDVTRRLQKLADNWVSTVGMSDKEIAEKISSDKIDILVDLAGHTKGNRLLVFAHKPAPVQVSWIGYPNTTGINTIDYRITDSIADPERLTDEYHTEKLVRLPKGFLCFKPNENSPDVSPSPYEKNKYITFGSLSDGAKISPEVIRIWSTILKSVPDSRLFLKSRALAENATRQLYFDMFEKFGISSNRIKFSGLVQSSIEHLDTYKNIDISLDTFPYSGTATTSESLWMGVPIITLAGDRFAGRTGASILTQIGLKDLITKDKEDYVKTAVALAGNLNHLNYLRNNLRSQISKSQFFNNKEFTYQVEIAYRDMWNKWCNNKNLI